MAAQKKTDIWMPLWVGDYLAGTMLLNTEQHGAYFLLILAAWKQGGRLPSAPEQLQAITRLSPAKWKAHEPLLRPYFNVTPSFWAHERVIEELEKAKKKSDARTKSGATGAAKRWGANNK
jgi:uncharacterized protein YdaU (DUF1376 family)